MKKIMIIGAGVYQLPLVQEAAKEQEVILVAPQINSVFEELAARCYICDVTDKEKILEYAQREKIDGVITDQTDIAVRTVAYVAEKMGLPGIGYQTACLFTDKSLMRDKCEELNIPTLPHVLARNLEQAMQFYKDIGADSVIIKPVDNQGSRGVQQVDSESDLRLKFEEAMRYSRSGGVLIEKRAKGREFVVESLCLDGKYYPLICGDTNYFNIKDAFAAKTRVFPSCAEQSLVDRVQALNKKIVTEFGLTQGISHSEYIMDGDELYLIETAARGGGVFISSDLISIGTGLNTEKFLIRIALGEQDSAPDLEYKNNACGYMAFFLPRGEVIFADGIDEVMRLPYVHRNLLHEIKIGLKTEFQLDKTTRYPIIVSASDLEELEKRMEYIRGRINIKVSDGENENAIIWE